MAFMFILFLALLNDINGKYRETYSCPSGIVQWKRRETLFHCPTNTPYHCILKYNTSQLYEACIPAVTIGPGQVGCPWIQFYKGIPIHGSKYSDCPVANPDCPPKNHKGYLSNQLYQYPACFLHRSARLLQITDVRSRSPSTTIKQGINSTQSNATDKPIQIWSAIGVVFGVLIVLTATVVLVIFIFRRRKIRGMCTSNDGSTQDTGEEEKEKFIESNKIKPLVEYTETQSGHLDDHCEDKAKISQQETQNEHSDDHCDDKDKTAQRETQNCHSDDHLEVEAKTSRQGLVISDSTSQKDETIIKERNPTNYQHEEADKKILVHCVFRSILDISDGIVSYHQLRSHFEKEGDCSEMLENLEIILRGNRNVFRLLEDDFIFFVIAYLPDADICDKYKPAIFNKTCVDQNCSKFHICTFFARNMCSKLFCRYSHNYRDTHNCRVKEQLHLSSYTDNDINKILLNRYPQVCATEKCDKENDCPYLHICIHLCYGKCLRGLKCRFRHSFWTQHNSRILKAYGISYDEIWSGSPIAKKLTIARMKYRSE